MFSNTTPLRAGGIYDLQRMVQIADSIVDRPERRFKYFLDGREFRYIASGRIPWFLHREDPLDPRNLVLDGLQVLQQVSRYVDSLALGIAYLMSKLIPLCPRIDGDDHRTQDARGPYQMNHFRIIVHDGRIGIPLFYAGIDQGLRETM